MTTTSLPRRAITSFVIASRYMPAYLALILLLIVASIWAPEALGGVALSAIAPLGALLGITALGQMLVIMTGGIDLSVPGTFTMAAIILVGVGDQMDDRVGVAIATAIGWAAVVGLVNGILIGVLKLNALIVTLAVGQVVVGLTTRYTLPHVWPNPSGFPVQRSVPVAWSEWISTRIFGVSPMFWIGLGVTLLLVAVFRFTTIGRRFRAVGANPVASHVMGVRVNLNQIGAYVIAAVLYAVAGVALAGILRTPGAGVGAPYLLGPIAAVVIGGASLTGGLASPMATLTAAFFLTGLNQMMRTAGLSTALQFVVFGLVIIGGMVISGDRITKGVERVLRERRELSEAYP